MNFITFIAIYYGLTIFLFHLTYSKHINDVCINNENENSNHLSRRSFFGDIWNELKKIGNDVADFGKKALSFIGENNNGNVGYIANSHDIYEVQRDMEKAKQEAREKSIKSIYEETFAIYKLFGEKLGLSDETIKNDIDKLKKDFDITKTKTYKEIKKANIKDLFRRNTEIYQKRNETNHNSLSRRQCGGLYAACSYIDYDTTWTTDKQKNYDCFVTSLPIIGNLIDMAKNFDNKSIKEQFDSVFNYLTGDLYNTIVSAKSKTIHAPILGMITSYEGCVIKELGNGTEWKYYTFIRDLLMFSVSLQFDNEDLRTVIKEVAKGNPKKGYKVFTSNLDSLKVITTSVYSNIPFWVYNYIEDILTKYGEYAGANGGYIANAPPISSGSNKNIQNSSGNKSKDTSSSSSGDNNKKSSSGSSQKSSSGSSSGSYTCKCSSSSWCNENCLNRLHGKLWYSANKGLAIEDSKLKSTFCKYDECREAFDDCRHTRESQYPHWRNCKKIIKDDFKKRYGEDFSIDDESLGFKEPSQKSSSGSSSSGSYTCKCSSSSWCNENCLNRLHGKLWYSANKGLAIEDSKLKSTFCKYDECREAFDDCRHTRESQYPHWRNCKKIIKDDFKKRYGEDFSIDDESLGFKEPSQKSSSGSSSGSYTCKCSSNSWCNENCLNRLHGKLWYSANKGLAIEDSKLKSTFCKYDECREAFDDCRHTRESQYPHWRNCKKIIKDDFKKRYGEDFSIDDKSLGFK
ncbi:hypothetical protein BCR32DRAFT_308530 [Anaeromyces robustus]|uniref:Uncharacterized protein n=1 Tax=Anaeromyces robustus TaxID=1754192 RepID=A0A1Y1XBV1_9FUNG|nr:hypothetical protein BCR32DRAFT_308530 [Anaeromyces robustus]|eukprot:ORX83219.1 hypothetical protein BCR32DRAFT_308530 [Anaeromyces robustus]